MSVMTTGVAGDMDFLDIRRTLKERIRKANNMKSYSADTKEAKSSSLFGSSETSLSQRLINESKALVPEMIKILEKTNKNNNDHPKPNSNVDLKAQGGKKLRNYSREYSFLKSESAEVPKNSKPSPPKPSSKADENGITKKSLPIPKADRNGIPKKSHDMGMVSSLKPKKRGDDNKTKISSGKSESVSKDSVPVSGSKSLKSRPRENVVTKSQASSAKESVCPKQAEVSNTKLVPRNEGPSLKRKLIKKHRVEEDLEDDDSVDISSVIQDIFGRRGKRRYTNHGDYGDDRAMVSGFRDILKEENRSARIAREEDAIEALRLEQEAKKERLSTAKKQKLMN